MAPYTKARRPHGVVPRLLRNPQAWSASLMVASMVLDDPAGTVQIKGATHYHADYVSPYWGKHYKFLGKSGAHLFYGPDK